MYTCTCCIYDSYKIHLLPAYWFLFFTSTSYKPEPPTAKPFWALGTLSTLCDFPLPTLNLFMPYEFWKCETLWCILQGSVCTQCKTKRMKQMKGFVYGSGPGKAQTSKQLEIKSPLPILLCFPSFLCHPSSSSSFYFRHVCLFLGGNYVLLLLNFLHLPAGSATEAEP